MSKKNINDIEEQLRRMREREARLKLELAEKKKIEDRRAYRELVRKKCNLADALIKRFGEAILDDDNIKDLLDQLNASGMEDQIAENL